jgi:hypothetical protein
MSHSSFLKWQVWNWNPTIKNISKLNIIIMNKIPKQVVIIFSNFDKWEII